MLRLDLLTSERLVKRLEELLPDAKCPPETRNRFKPIMEIYEAADNLRRIGEERAMTAEVDAFLRSDFALDELFYSLDHALWSFAQEVIEFLKAENDYSLGRSKRGTYWYETTEWRGGCLLRELDGYAAVLQETSARLLPYSAESVSALSAKVLCVESLFSKVNTLMHNNARLFIKRDVAEFLEERKLFAENAVHPEREWWFFEEHHHS